jgi:hypothetical protein
MRKGDKVDSCLAPHSGIISLSPDALRPLGKHVVEISSGVHEPPSIGLSHKYVRTSYVSNFYKRVCL